MEEQNECLGKAKKIALLLEIVQNDLSDLSEDKQQVIKNLAENELNAVLNNKRNTKEVENDLAEIVKLTQQLSSVMTNTLQQLTEGVNTGVPSRPIPRRVEQNHTPRPSRPNLDTNPYNEFPPGYFEE